MGLAASQARYLSLTARKTNVEYEGQQVNQQRTALANQSAGLFNQMLALNVPTPPSKADYSKTCYVFTDAATGQIQTIESIYIDDAKSDNNKTIANLHVRQTQTKRTYNAIDYTTADYNFSKDDDDKISATINGMTLSYKGKVKMNSDLEGFQAAHTENQGTDITKPKEDDEYFKFIDNKTGVEYYIPAGEFESPEKITGNIVAYTLQYSKSTELKTYDGAELHKANDGTGRWEYMVYTDPETKKSKRFDLTQQTTEDKDAYDAAMETYVAEKAIYEKTVEEINAQTLVIQQQDKTLELHLDQLDTEQQAIQTELDAVKKVIDKNIEETFKTFA